MNIVGSFLLCGDKYRRGQCANGRARSYASWDGDRGIFEGMFFAEGICIERRGRWLEWIDVPFQFTTRETYIPPDSRRVNLRVFCYAGKITPLESEYRLSALQL